MKTTTGQQARRQADRRARRRAELERLAREIARHDELYYARGRAGDLGRRLRRPAPAQCGHRGALSRSRAPRQPVLARRRRAGGGLRQGAPCRADALARQRLHRRGRGRLHRPRAPLPGPRRRCRGRADGGAQDRRALHLAHLRGGPARAGGDARRRHRGRERHPQRHDDEADPPSARGQGRAGSDRGARRDLSAPRRFREAQCRAGGGRRPRSSPIRGTRRPARCASSIPRSRRGGRCASSPTAGARRARCRPRPNPASTSASSSGACRSTR